MDITSISNMTGNALAIALMLFFINYFMRKDEKRERFIARVIRSNTEALKILAEAVSHTEAGKHIDRARLNKLHHEAEYGSDDEKKDGD
jgi:hypothetical protein